jgi:lipoprotein-anchoring transpeptidase ErfK/SrfK
MAMIAVLASGIACRTHPVSVVVPESEDKADLAPLSASGDTSWRVSAEADLQARARPLVTSHWTKRQVAGHDSGFASISAETVNAEPTDDGLVADDGPAVLRAQVLLDRAHYSSGVLNGRAGQNTSKAVYFYQAEHGLPATGHLDRQTYVELIEQVGDIQAVVPYILTYADIRGPYFWIPVSVYDQADLPCECYASALEMLDERFHTVTDVLRKLNPKVSFARLAVGQVLWVPNVEPFDASRLAHTTPRRPIKKIRVAKDGRYVHALAADGSIVYHFPTTVGSEYDPSPSGIYSVEGVQWHPVFHYNPSLYSDARASSPTATLPPGPNSPVGVVWIATSKEHVGIHGTALPHTIGLASSHGCVRLTNWDAARLAGAVRPGVVIEFVH